jgi:hypothetical protein
VLPIGFGADFAPHPSAPFAGYGNANGHASDNADPNAADDTASPSNLGALNAAPASPQALAHANPNSREGMIAAYQQAAIAAKATDQAVVTAQANLAAANQAVADAQNALTAAQAALAANVDPAQAASLTAAVNTAQANLDAANQTAATDAQALANAQAAAATADATRDQALAAAANKPVTDRVIDAVNSLLGIN